MLTYIIPFLIDSIVSCFVTIDLPREGSAVEVPDVSRVATRELLSIDFHKFIHYKYLPRFGIVAPLRLVPKRWTTDRKSDVCSSDL